MRKKSVKQDRALWYFRDYTLKFSMNSLIEILKLKKNKTTTVVNTVQEDRHMLKFVPQESQHHNTWSDLESIMI